MYDLVVKGRISRDGSWIDASICIEDGLITGIKKVSPGRSTAGDYHDFNRKLIIPGIIDSHVHMRDPGLTSKEDFGTGSISAAFGGVTTILDMPNTYPPTVDRVSFLRKMGEATRKSVVDYGLYLGIIDDTDGDTLEASIGGEWVGGQPAAFKCFLGESTGKLTISRIEDIGRWASIIHGSGKPLAIHAEDGDILAGSGDREFRGNILEQHCDMRPPEAERSAIDRAVNAMGQYASSLHVLHVSTELGIGTAAGSGVTVEVTPHHLHLDLKWAEGLERKEYAKVNPPIRRRSDRAALWKGVTKGSVNTIGSDHAPHEIGSKQDGLDSPSGMPGVETMLPLLLCRVKERQLSFSKMQDLLCTNPARRYDLNRKGRIDIGMEADLVVVDMADERTIRAEDLHSKCGWTPYDGMRGIFPSHVFSRGDILIENGVLCEKNGRGRMVF